jgi:hypothetical protein
MITKLLQITDAAVGAALPVTTRYILASLKAGQPVVHTGGGNHTPIANDLSGHWSYQRIRGEVSVITTSLAGDPCEGLQATVPLRIVALLDRDTCIEEAVELAAVLRASTRQAQTAIGAFAVTFDRIGWSFDQNAGQEFAPLPQIPTNRTLLVMDATVVVRGKASCMVDCDPVDVTCAIIAASTLDKIRECLGPRLSELCEVPVVPCPLTWTVSDQEGNVLAEGVVTDPCATPELDIEVDCEGGECDPLRLTINGSAFDTVENPCDTAVDVPVINTSTTPVGSKVGDNWVVGNSLITFDGILLQSIPAETDLNISCERPINAVVVDGPAGIAGIYTPDGDLNGKPVYSKGADFFAWNNTRWVLNATPGPNIEAAPGSEDFPWEADWSGATPTITVARATIGTYCADCPPPEPCPPTTVNGVESETPTITVTQNDVPIGTFDPVTGNVDIPPCDPCPSLCSQITTAETIEITDCIRSAGKRTAVQCDLMGTAEVVDALTEFACFPEAVRDAILASECPAGGVDTIRLQFQAFTDEIRFDIDASTAGTYVTASDDGSSGTVTWSINGGAFAAWPGATALVNGDYIRARRTTLGAIGWAQIVQ